MNFHAAKGLEVSVVFIVGCENGLMPFHHDGIPLNQSDVNEERRLLYVGMTRAERRLYLTWARKRTRYGKTQSTSLSPFISNIDKRLLSRREPVFGSKKGQNQTQLKLF